ncbi:MAG: AAA family ATPase [Myxococcota bacterium]|nr:AAA family ATPase [Myxococcota bacterium]
MVLPTLSLTTLFEESCDPHGYIPRRASEEVLRCLSSLVRDGEPAVVLHGPSGIGKTMLMRVLAERFEDERRVAYVPLSDAPAPELTHRVLDELSEPATDDPAADLVRVASSASRGEPRLLVLVDHADLAPIASSLQLVSAAQNAAPHLTIVFAVADEAGAEEFARAIAANARVTALSFSQSMDPSEATAYVRLRLARADVPAAVRERLEDRAVAWLSESAQATLPREINRRAAELLRSYEEDGEAALRVRIEHEDTRPPESWTSEPRAIDPSEVPRDGAVEPHPPSFPMSPGGPAPGSAPGPGSLGGMLLGHGPGPKPNFEIDLELGRSLSSGLLESQRPQHPQHPQQQQPAEPEPVVRDGKPVPPAPFQDEADPERRVPASPPPGSEPNRPILITTALITTLLMVGGFFAMRSSIEPEPVEATPGANEFAQPGTSPGEAIPPALEGDGLPVPAEETAATDSLEPEPAALAAAADAPPPTPAPEAPAASDARPSLVAGPMLDSGLAHEAQEPPAPEPPTATATATPAPAPAPPAPVAKRATTPRRAKGPLILQSGDSAEISNPGSYARLVIDVEEGAEIFVDGKSIGRAPFDEIMVEMGTHTFMAEMPDGITIEQLVDVQIGTDIVEF